MLSIRIAALEESEDCAYKSKTNELQAKFLADLAKASNVAEALMGPALSLLDFIPSTGAVVCFKDKILKLGRTPEDSNIRLVVKDIVKRMRSPIFASDRLQDRLLEAREFTDTASGALCFTVSRAHDFHVMWFRTEQVQVVSWGGDPNKPAEPVTGSERLNPRKSFEVWKQEVKGQSKAWTQSEIDASAELRSTLMSLMLSRDASTA
jgi:light-regulated signal transduction histidine kinase (bacteriophytochrome)